jgi:hypothetical protein
VRCFVHIILLQGLKTMKFIQTAIVTSAATILTVASAFAQTAPAPTSTQVDMQAINAEGTVYMGITEARSNSGEAFSAGTVVNPEFGTTLSVNSSVIAVDEEGFAKTIGADGKVLTDKTDTKNNVSATGTVLIGSDASFTNADDSIKGEVTGAPLSSTSKAL